MKRVLLIAFHYPPVKGSSGLQRTLAFSRYLPDHGWQPAVLTVNPRAYSRVSEEQLSQIPDSCPVVRAFGLDSSRHLALFGRYPRRLALPDNWVSWTLGGVPAGLRMIRRFSPDVIWSTYPVASAHLIGYLLHRLSGLPWVADFRDSMTEEGYPTEPAQRRSYQRVERRTVAHCDRAVFTAPGALEMYASRYPDVPRERWALIPNGYDDQVFVQAEQDFDFGSPPSHPICLVHSGALYPEERDPRQFYAALRQLLDAGELSPGRVRIMLRATGHDAHHGRLIAEHGVESIVQLGEALPYQEALREMMQSHGLLLFQADNCNQQIPAKLYEYVRAARPVYAMTSRHGDTAGELRNVGFEDISPLDDQAAIAKGFMEFVRKIEGGKAFVPDAETIRHFDRRTRTAEFAQLLNEVSSQG